MFGPKRKLDNIYFGTGKKNKKIIDNNAEDIGIENIFKNTLMTSLEKKREDIKVQRENNHIYFHCEVDRESIFELTTLIREAEEESLLTSFKLNIEEVPIYLHINSLGGCVYSAFSLIDIINSCRIPIYTIVEGATASAGTLISIFGKKRYIRPNAHMLIHQLSSECWGKMSEIEDEFKNLQDLMDKIKSMYKDNTKIPKKELNEILKHDLWLDSDKCLKYGLVDELWLK
jgi:ATP-dependent Clp endopeptidase proteolytic subunit ClpP